MTETETEKPGAMFAEIGGRIAALVTSAIQDAVKQDRAEATALLKRRIDDCICAAEPDETPCQSCYETTVIISMLENRKPIATSGTSEDEPK